MTKTVINIIQLFNNIITSRDEAIKLFNSINKFQHPVTEIVLDFAGIDFISRSFADQFYKEKMDWKVKTNIPLSITNATVQIIEILEAVSRTQSKKDRTVKEIPVYSFTSEELLSEYMQTI